MPGYLVNGQCIGDPAMAAELWASLNYPKIVVTSSYSYTYYVSGVVGSSVSVSSVCAGNCTGITAFSYSQAPVLRSCDPLEYPNSIFAMGVTDGAAVAAAVAGVWVAAYALRAVRRVLSGSGGGESA